eukprot:SAG11_NODE_6959_length_1219_cov_1.322321_1_plen_230_part_10
MLFIILLACRCDIVNSAIGDNNRACRRKALELLITAIETLGTEMGAYVAIVLDPLVERLGDSQAVSSALAAGAFDALAHSTTVFDRIVIGRHLDHPNWRVRLQLLQALCRKLIRADGGRLPPALPAPRLWELADAIVRQLVARRPVVRAAAADAALALYQSWLGADLLALVERAHVRPAIADSLQQRCRATGPGAPLRRRKLKGAVDAVRAQATLKNLTQPAAAEADTAV